MKRQGPHPTEHRLVVVTDQDGDRACLTCNWRVAWGDTSRSIGSRFLPPNVANRLVAHVPEPVAELDDDEFANTRFGA